MNQIKLKFFKSIVNENYIQDAYSFLQSINFYNISKKETELSVFSQIHNKFKLDPIFSQIRDLHKHFKTLTSLREAENENATDINDTQEQKTPKNDSKDNISNENKYSQMIELIMKKKKEEEEKQIEFENKYKKLLSIMEEEDLLIFNHMLNEDPNLRKKLFTEKGENFEKIVTFEQSTFNYFLSELEEKKNYIKINNPDFELYYKKGKSDITLQFEKEVEIDVVDFMSLIYEVEIYPKWFPFTYHAETILQVGKAKKLIYMINDIPVLSNRDFLVYGFGVNRVAEKKCIYLLCKSIEESSGIFKEQCERKQNKNFVRADIKIFGYEINIINKNRLLIKGVLNCDPKIKVIPQFLINSVSQKVLLSGLIYLVCD